MSTALLCLIGYALWAILLVLVIAAYRVPQVLTGKKGPNDFPAGVPHGSDAYWRANRAHLNTTENLPIFAAVVLVGSLTSADTLPQFGTLAMTALCARMVQSIVHLSSGSAMAVNVRFTAFSVQIGCIVWMAYVIVTRAAALG